MVQEYRMYHIGTKIWAQGLKIYGFFILVPSFSPQLLLPYMVSFYYILYFFLTIGTKRSKIFNRFEKYEKEIKLMDTYSYCYKVWENI